MKFCNMMDKIKILVVDDSETNLVLLEAVLQNSGYEVNTANNSNQAIYYLENNIPELILLDLLMPNVNGFDFIKILQKNKKWKDIPVIIVTAYANQENIEMANQLGVVDMIEKPIDINEFLERINKSFEFNQ